MLSYAKKASHFQTIIMVSCFLASICYSAMIVFNVADVFFDWCEFSEVFAKGTFSSIPVDSNLATFLFCASCVSGTIICFIMVAFYGGYIKKHIRCMFTSEESRACDKKYSRHFFTYELQISMGELVAKDIIQSNLLLYFWMQKREECVDFWTKMFVVCSILAHTKIFVCLAKNLSGLRVKEELGIGVCVFGFINSLLCLSFTLFFYSVATMC